MLFKLVPERQEFTAYAARIAARPAARRAEEKDKELRGGVMPLHLSLRAGRGRLASVLREQVG